MLKERNPPGAKFAACKLVSFYEMDILAKNLQFHVEHLDDDFIIRSLSALATNRSLWH